MKTAIRMALVLAGLGGTSMIGGRTAWSRDTNGTDDKQAPAATDQKPQKGDRKHRASDTAKVDPKVDADNTGANKRDRSAAEPTADQGKSGKSDVQLAAEIRRAIVKDKSLSTNAHNIKIIVQDGDVTLKGPVKSGDEKASVEKKATDIVARGSKGKVVSEVAVAP